MRFKKWLTTALCMLLALFLCMPTAIFAEAASGPTLTTTLTDNIIQRGSKKTFDVWARSASGEKIKATVKLNGQKVEPTWEDNEKASYTLVFTAEGENIVTVAASSDGGKKKQLTYHITYQKAAAGESIGVATWSIEMFTIGCGYLIYPVEVEIYEGETAAEQLIRLLHKHGFVGYYGGTVKSSFYLAYIADGTASGEKYNNYQKSGAPSNPQYLNLSPSIPSMLTPFLEDTMTFYDPDDYKKNWKGYLGEFAFTNGSGWMYCINNVFPNVGFADSYLSDGDVVRVQFTLGYGADIGGFGAVGTDIPNVDNHPSSAYFAAADKDKLSQTICQALSSGLMTRENVKKAYASALSAMETLNAPQETVDAAVSGLSYALSNPVNAQPQTPAETTSPDTQASAETNPPKNSEIPAVSDTPNTEKNTVSGKTETTVPPAVTAGSSDVSQTVPDETASTSKAEANSANPFSDAGLIKPNTNIGMETKAADGSTASSDSQSADSRKAKDTSETGTEKTTGEDSDISSETMSDESSEYGSEGEEFPADGNSSAGSVIIAVISLLSLAAIAVIAAAFYIKRKKAAKLSSPEQKGNGEND